jgi:hypothetical protein
VLAGGYFNIDAYYAASFSVISGLICRYPDDDTAAGGQYNPWAAAGMRV